MIDETPKKPIRLVLHPGHDKCGSSFIQSFIYSNRNTLEKHGVYVPDINFRFSFEKSSIFRSANWCQPTPYFSEIIYGGSALSLFETRLKEALKAASEEENCQTLIVSSETLKNIQEAGCQEIHRIFSKHFDEITLIYYIRRQDDYMVSSWQQWRHKVGKSLNKYINECFSSGNPQFLATVEFFEEIYGIENLKIRLLFPESLIEKNLAKDFCYYSKINLNEDSLHKPVYDKNQSLNPHLCETLCRIHRIYNSTNPNKRISDIHNDTIKELLNKYLDTDEILWKNDKKYLPEEKRAEILRFFEEENRALCSKYISGIAFENYFTHPSITPGEPYNKLTDEIENLKDIVAIQMELIIKILEQRESRKSRLKQAILMIKKFVFAQWKN